MSGQKRLAAEYKQIMKRKDLANFVAVPEEDNIFEWHFLVFGLMDCPYENGFYHGKLSFPRDYPFKPPGIQVLTPNGRFQPNQRICTSFSDYHPELWDPSWNVETIVLGLISFWLSTEATAGSIRTTDEEKRRLCAESLKYNFSKGPRFQKIFGDWFP